MGVIAQAALWQILLLFFSLPMLSASDSLSDPKSSMQRCLSLMYKSLSSISPTISSSHYFWASCVVVKQMPKLSMQKEPGAMQCCSWANAPELVGCVFHSQAGKSSTWICCSRAQHTAQHQAELSHCSSGCKVTKVESFQHKTCLILN